nr:DUF3265 domain-containing protein [Vibrio anguillarum]
MCITRRLRGIHAAWHFWYAVVLVVKVVCGKLVCAALTLNAALCVF